MKKKLISDSFILLVGTLLNTLLMLFMQIVLARHLVLEEYGAVMTSFNLINFLALFLSLGASEYILKIFGKSGGNNYKIVQTWLKVLPIVMIVLCGLVFLVFKTNILDEMTSKFLFIIFPNIILQGLLPITLAVHQIEQNYKKMVLVSLIIYLVRFLAVLFSFISEGNIYFIGYTLSILSIIGLAYYYKSLKRYFVEDLKLPYLNSIDNSRDKTLKDFIKGLMPYALLGFFYYGFHQSNIVLISLLMDEEAVAIYNAAFTIISLTFILPTIFLAQLFTPKLHFWINNDIYKVKKLFIYGNKAMLLLGIFIMAILFFIGDIIINTMFGAEFKHANHILLMLIIIIPIRYVQAVSDVIMNTGERINTKCKIFFVVAIFSVIMNLILIPSFGLYGVIFTALITESILLILTFRVCWRFIKNIIL